MNHLDILGNTWRTLPEDTSRVYNTTPLPGDQNTVDNDDTKKYSFKTYGSWDRVIFLGCAVINPLVSIVKIVWIQFYIIIEQLSKSDSFSNKTLKIIVILILLNLALPMELVREQIVLIFGIFSPNRPKETLNGNNVEIFPYHPTILIFKPQLLPDNIQKEGV